jgi:hypothetical protein
MADEITLGTLGKAAALAGGPLGLAQKYGPDIYNALNEGLRPLFEEAGKLQQYGNEYYDAGPATLAALGTIGAPAAAGGVPLGALGSGVGKGIRAYHGSPHDFDRFDLSKIGTGEGAQAYGHGLYFAENPAVAQNYKEGLVDRVLTPAQGIADNIMNTVGYGREKGIDYLRTQLERNQNLKNFPVSADEYRQAIKLLETGWEAPKGRMYEVNINAAPEQFLDWDKQLSAQPQAVQELISNIPQIARQQKFQTEFLGPEKGVTGSGIYRMASQEFPNVASETMREAGIPGIKYLDQGSRTAGQGSSNYVLFRDDIIDILRKYGLAGLAPAAGVAAVGNQTNPPQQQ